jgi:hypothetical protein
VTLYCTRCGTPATRRHVQAMDDNDTCPHCGGGCWQPADAPPTVKYHLNATDREWLRSLRVQVDGE